MSLKSEHASAHSCQPVSVVTSAPTGSASVVVRTTTPTPLDRTGSPNAEGGRYPLPRSLSHPRMAGSIGHAQHAQERLLRPWLGNGSLAPRKAGDVDHPDGSADEHDLSIDRLLRADASCSGGHPPVDREAFSLFDRRAEFKVDE